MTGRDTMAPKVADAEDAIRGNHRTSALLLNRTKAGLPLDEFAVNFATTTWLRKQREAGGKFGPGQPRMHDLGVKECEILVGPSVGHVAYPTIGERPPHANGKAKPGKKLFVSTYEASVLAVSHQLAHLVPVPDDQGYHGPEFVKAWLYIVNRYIGADAKRLLVETLRGYGVKTRTYSPEARARASDRMKIRMDRDTVDDLLALRQELEEI